MTKFITFCLLWAAYCLSLAIGQGFTGGFTSSVTLFIGVCYLQDKLKTFINWNFDSENTKVPYL